MMLFGERIMPHLKCILLFKEFFFFLVYIWVRYPLQSWLPQISMLSLFSSPPLPHPPSGSWGIAGPWFRKCVGLWITMKSSHPNRNAHIEFHLHWNKLKWRLREWIFIKDLASQSNTSIGKKKFSYHYYLDKCLFCFVSSLEGMFKMSFIKHPYFQLKASLNKFSPSLKNC